jgi:hypothetical protein
MGRGFSASALEKADAIKKTIKQLRENDMKILFFRKSYNEIKNKKLC